MSDRYIVFVEVHSHNLRHFLHQQRWAVIRYDRNTGYFETVSSRVLLELIQLDFDITCKTIVAELVYMSSLISLIWLFTPSLCYFTSLIVDITVSYFFKIKFWDLSISSNLFLRSRRLSLSESISSRISFRILGRNYFAHSSFKLSTVKLMLWVKFCTVKLLNSVRLNSPRV